MRIEYAANEFKLGTLLRRIYFYDDDGDVIMTDAPVYETIEESEEENDESEDE